MFYRGVFFELFIGSKFKLQSNPNFWALISSWPRLRFMFNPTSQYPIPITDN
ncbi:hypothetical protein Hanom_Chr16g01521841 [Helianthus anomalus]